MPPSSGRENFPFKNLSYGVCVAVVLVDVAVAGVVAAVVAAIAKQKQIGKVSANRG